MSEVTMLGFIEKLSRKSRKFPKILKNEKKKATKSRLFSKKVPTEIEEILQEIFSTHLLGPLIP